MNVTNPEALELVMAALAGLAAGALFFGGLYFTTRRIASARRPALLAVGSFAGRVAAVVAVAILVAEHLGAWGMLAMLAGLTTARIALVVWAKRAEGV